MADLTPAYKGVDPASIVRALKGDRELNKNFPGDYSVGNQWFNYGPSNLTPDWNPNVAVPTAADMNKDPSAPTPAPKPMVNPTNLGWNRVAGGLFGVPQQHLQQMAGDLIPFPKTLIEQDQQRSKGPDWPLSNVKPFDEKGDMTGGGKVIPLPLPNVLSGLTPVG